jgi:hypothetical protein
MARPEPSTKIGEPPKAEEETSDTVNPATPLALKVLRSLMWLLVAKDR